MSEQDSNITSEDEDVEAHKKSRYVASASDEAPKDDESDDDVELHGRKSQKSL